MTGDRRNFRVPVVPRVLAIITASIVAVIFFASLLSDHATADRRGVNAAVQEFVSDVTYTDATELRYRALCPAGWNSRTRDLVQRLLSNGRITKWSVEHVEFLSGQPRRATAKLNYSAAYTNSSEEKSDSVPIQLTQQSGYWRVCPETAPAAVIDGTYRLDRDGTKATVNGAPYAGSKLTEWYAFRSSCGSNGCVATGTKLDDNNHQVASAPATTTVWHWVAGSWQRLMPKPGSHHQQECLGPNGTVGPGEETTLQMNSYTPQPDGTLVGVVTVTTVTNECGNQGSVYQAPIMATRVSDVPPGVSVADPATVTPATVPSTPPPADEAPALNGTYRVDLIGAEVTTDGARTPAPNETTWYAFRSSCRSTACVATGTELDNNHQATGNRSEVFHFADGHWQDSPYLSFPRCIDPPNPTPAATFTWSMEPQPDGTLNGVVTATFLTDKCPGGGKVMRTPMVATRVGDVPPSLVLADPALFFGGPGNQAATPSSAGTGTVDSRATAVHACSTFMSAAGMADKAEIAWIQSVKANAPEAEKKQLLQSMQQNVTVAVQQVKTALTPDVPNPPAGALRAWVNEETLLTGPMPANTDPVDVMTKASELETPATDACKPFSS